MSFLKFLNQVFWWRCSKCGHTANSSTKPGMNYGGKCKGSSSGMHSWVKER